MNVQQAIDKLIDFHAWFEAEADEADHDHGNWAECPGCRWAGAARDMSAVIDTLRSAQPAPPEPDWTQAPDWAQWWCMNSDGSSAWCEIKPKYGLHRWDYWNSGARWAIAGHEHDYPIGIDWRTTLQRRPAADETEHTTEAEAE